MVDFTHETWHSHAEYLFAVDRQGSGGPAKETSWGRGNNGNSGNWKPRLVYFDDLSWWIPFWNMVMFQFAMRFMLNYQRVSVTYLILNPAAESLAPGSEVSGGFLCGRIQRGRNGSWSVSCLYLSSPSSPSFQNISYNWKPWKRLWRVCCLNLKIKPFQIA